MATWKKVIVSGSSAELAALQVDNLTSGQVVIGGGSAGNLSTTAINGSGNILATTGATNVSISGSFSGSFQGDGSALTGVVAQNAFALSQGAGITTFSYNGSSAQTVSVDSASLAGNGLTTSGGKFTVQADGGTLTVGASGVKVSDGGIDTTQLADGAVTTAKIDDAAVTTAKIADANVTNAKLANSSIALGNTSVALGASGSTIDGLVLTSVVASGSFTGSFVGDGSGLTGIATVLAVSGSTGNGAVNLKTQALTITGTANEIETSVSGQTVTIGLPDDVTIGGDLVVSQNLTVLGTASFQQTTNLEVADRFVLLASGSNTAGDGGIVVQQGTQNVGELFAFDSGTTRWAFTSSFDAASSTFTPEAFVAAAIVGASADPTAIAARYQAKGNIFVGSDDEIWIYS